VTKSGRRADKKAWVTLAFPQPLIKGRSWLRVTLERLATPNATSLPAALCCLRLY
jgi:hypothetical protein